MLVLHEKTKIAVVKDSRPELVRLGEAVGKHTIYDTYGNKHEIEISEPQDADRMFVLTSYNGEPVIAGPRHSVYCRMPDGARWKRESVEEITSPRFVRLPQKKVYPSPDVFEYMDFDDSGIFLVPESVSQILDVMEKSAFCGVLTRRHKTELRINLEQGRPSCFASKLFTGNFATSLEQTLEKLAATGVVQPWHKFDDSLVENVKRTGVIFEGHSLFSEVPLIDVRPVDAPGRVCHINHVGSFPVELVWLMT